jgi:hypothetical protein
MPHRQDQPVHRELIIGPLAGGLDHGAQFAVWVIHWGFSLRAFCQFVIVLVCAALVNRM